MSNPTSTSAKSRKAPLERRDSWWWRVRRVVNAHRDRKITALAAALVACLIVKYALPEVWQVEGRRRTVSGVEIALPPAPAGYYLERVEPAEATLNVNIVNPQSNEPTADMLRANLVLPQRLVCDGGADCGKLHSRYEPHRMTLSLNREFCDSPEGIAVRAVQPENVVLYWDREVTREFKVQLNYNFGGSVQDGNSTVEVSTEERAVLRGASYLLHAVRAVGSVPFSVETGRKNDYGSYEQEVALALPDSRMELVNPRVKVKVNFFERNRTQDRNIVGVRINYLLSQNEMGSLMLVGDDGGALQMPDIIEVIVTGSHEAVSRLTARDIVAYCDLTVFPRSDAIHEVDVRFKLPPGVSIKEANYPPPRRLYLKWRNASGEYQKTPLRTPHGDGSAAAGEGGTGQ